MVIFGVLDSIKEGYIDMCFKYVVCEHGWKENGSICTQKYGLKNVLTVATKAIKTKTTIYLASQR